MRCLTVVLLPDFPPTSGPAEGEGLPPSASVTGLLVGSPGCICLALMLRLMPSLANLAWPEMI